ncbi:hypothetical protein BB931_05000 [Spiribacter salinus]|nr:hypothetical protein [Spiribacter salinus]
MPDGSVGVVYASHFFEHIPRDSIAGFLQECFRILAPGGSIRLVLPDFEEMASTYLKYRSTSEHEKAEFLIVEIIDQAVRRRPGGELGDTYRQLRSQTGESAAEMRQFINGRNGEAFGGLTNKSQFAPNSASKQASKQASRVLRTVQRRIINIWIRACLRLLPSAFRAQNVSLAGIGERHQWLWDFHQVTDALHAAGFVDARKMAFDQTAIDDFPWQALDAGPDGSPRKGEESMYIEARKSV